MISRILILGGAALLRGGCTFSKGILVTSSTNHPKGMVTHTERCGEVAVVSSPNAYVGQLKGVALRHSVLLGLIQWGSTGVGEAAQKASPVFTYRNDPNIGIREVSTVSKGGVKILWGLLYANEQTVVTGDDYPKEKPKFRSSYK